MQVSRAGIVQTERLEMPFLWLVWIIAPCNTSALEANAHFIDVDILRASELFLILSTEMIKERCDSPERIFFLHIILFFLAEQLRLDDVKRKFDIFKTLTSKALFDKGIGVARVLTPIRTHSWLSFQSHVQNNAKETIQLTN